MESHMPCGKLMLASRRILTEQSIFIKDSEQFQSIFWNHIIRGISASKYIQGMYIWGESTGGGHQDWVYRKASWVKGRTVSLHNWTGYFYTMLMSWAACWHVYPYILSNILSNSLSLSLHATSISPPRTPSTRRHHHSSSLSSPHFYSLRLPSSSSSYPIVCSSAASPSLQLFKQSVIDWCLGTSENRHLLDLACFPCNRSHSLCANSIPARLPS